MVIERQFTVFPGVRVSAASRHDGACAPRAWPGQALRLTALPAPGAAEVSGVKGGRRPFPQETRSALEAGGAAP